MEPFIIFQNEPSGSDVQRPGLIWGVTSLRTIEVPIWLMSDVFGG